MADALLRVQDHAIPVLLGYGLQNVSLHSPLSFRATPIRPIPVSPARQGSLSDTAAAAVE